MNYCNRCGIQLNESDSYCLRCGNKSRNDFTPDDRQARIELKSEPNSHCYPNSFCNNLMQFGTKRACKIFCVKSKSWYNHFIQNGGLQNGKKETQPCKCSRYRPYF